MFPVLLLMTGFVAYIAYRIIPAHNPTQKWKRFLQPDTELLDSTTYHCLQGIYTIEKGRWFFGNKAVVKWTYTMEGKKTVHHLSFFCKRGSTFLVCEGKRQHNEILLFGFWRRTFTKATGTVELVITAADGAATLLGALLPSNKISIQGKFGRGNKEPSHLFSLHFQQPLPQKPPFEIIAHRGGARNLDYLPFSENTLNMVKMAAQLGATGVELDVRITKDGVPVLFHDYLLSIQSIRDSFYGGLLHNYTLQQLKDVTLIKGGEVPTLQEVLHTILYQTPLETIWLDIKRECNLNPIRNLQTEYLQRAAAIGRTLHIYIGIPNKKVMECFTLLKDYQHVPALVEYDAEDALKINAEVWAPQYVGGFQQKKVERIHLAGKKAFVWSLDSKLLVDWYVSKGHFDGVLTNAPSLVAYWYYTADEKKLIAQ